MNDHDADEMVQRLDEAFSRVTYRRDLADLAPLRTEVSPRRKAPLVVVATLALGALTVGGIVAARPRLPDPVRYAADVRSAAQAEALVDDVVTFDEYDAGFRRFADCMERDDRALVDVTFDSMTQLYAYGYDGIDDCYEREFYAVDLSWQLSDSRPRDPARPDVSAVEMLEACRTGGPAPLGVPDVAFETFCAQFGVGSPASP